MAEICLENVTVDFPVYGAIGRSLRSHVLASASASRIDSHSQKKPSVRAINDLSFQIGKGERLALLGPNGSGKSTLLRVLSKVLRPTIGTAKVVGKVSSLVDIRAGMNFSLSGRDNILLMGSLGGTPRQTILEALEEIVLFSGLGEFIEAPVGTYSTGMQLRLATAIAIAIFQESEILLMDEWLSVGDSSFREKTDQKIATDLAEEAILVFASHSRASMERHCTRDLWIDSGQVVMDGPILNVTDSYFRRSK
jgi:lipopolysaccharide transport system ATP-binding protein